MQKNNIEFALHENECTYTGEARLVSLMAKDNSEMAIVPISLPLHDVTFQVVKRSLFYLISLGLRYFPAFL